MHDLACSLTERLACLSCAKTLSCPLGAVLVMLRLKQLKESTETRPE